MAGRCLAVFICHCSLLVADRCLAVFVVVVVVVFVVVLVCGR